LTLTAIDIGSRDTEKTEETVIACRWSPFAAAKTKTFCFVVLRTSRNLSFKVNKQVNLKTDYVMYYHK
jgi:hypothetical protein